MSLDTEYTQRLLPLFDPFELDFWLSYPVTFLNLPDEFTIYCTWDIGDYPPGTTEVAGDPLFNDVCGVYCFFLEWFKDFAWHREYLYFGKALDCRQRFLQHFRKVPGGPFDRWLHNYYFTDKWIEDDRIPCPWFSVAPCIPEKRAELEYILIKEFSPSFNVCKQ